MYFIVRSWSAPVVSCHILILLLLLLLLSSSSSSSSSLKLEILLLEFLFNYNHVSRGASRSTLGKLFTHCLCSPSSKLVPVQAGNLNRHPTRHTSPVDLQLRLVSGWGLLKRRSAPPNGPLGSGMTLCFLGFYNHVYAVCVDNFSRRFVDLFFAATDVSR